MKNFENCLSLYMMENIGTGRRVLAYSTAEIADVLGIPERVVHAEMSNNDPEQEPEQEHGYVFHWRIWTAPRVFVGMTVYGDAEYLCRDEQWNLYTLGGAPYPKEDVVKGSLIEVTFEFYDRELDKVLERAEELGL